MPMILPKFENTHCRTMTVCGLLATEDKELLARLAKPVDLCARYRASGSTRYIHVGLGGRRGKHLHVDVAVRENFGSSPPSAKDKIAEVRDALERLEDQKIDAGISGVFHLPLGDLPDFIQATLQVEAQVGEISLKTIGGRFAIRGAPINTIFWWMSTDASHVCVELRARRKTQVQDSYLHDSLDLLEQGYKALLLRD